MLRAAASILAALCCAWPVAGKEPLSAADRIKARVGYCYSSPAEHQRESHDVALELHFARNGDLLRVAEIIGLPDTAAGRAVAAAVARAAEACGSFEPTQDDLASYDNWRRVRFNITTGRRTELFYR